MDCYFTPVVRVKLVIILPDGVYFTAPLIEPIHQVTDANIHRLEGVRWNQLS